MSRLIDADILEKAKFHPLPYTHIVPQDTDAESYKRGWNDAIDAIVENEPTVSAEPEWIPISEQMPKKAGNYLVTDHKGDIARYIFLDSESSKDYWMRCVKAWMPLPDPYKGE